MLKPSKRIALSIFAFVVLTIVLGIAQFNKARAQNARSLALRNQADDVAQFNKARAQNTVPSVTATDNKHDSDSGQVEDKTSFRMYPVKNRPQKFVEMLGKLMPEVVAFAGPADQMIVVRGNDAAHTQIDKLIAIVGDFGVPKRNALLQLENAKAPEVAKILRLSYPELNIQSLQEANVLVLMGAEQQLGEVQELASQLDQLSTDKSNSANPSAASNSNAEKDVTDPLGDVIRS